MSAAELLATLRARDCELTAAGERLRVEAPAGALTPDLRDALTAHKADLLLELEAEAAWATVEAIAAEMRRRWARAEQLEQSDDPEDRFLAEHHRDDVRGAVTACWLPAMKRWATLEHRLGRLDPEHAWLADAARDEDGDNV